MAAATKKRGRPTREEYAYYYHLRNENNTEESDRTVRTNYNAEQFIIILLDDAPAEVYFFFTTREGLTKHKGIAEQLGRMIQEGVITENQAIKRAEQCVNDYYKRGKTSKEIEKELRQERINSR